LAILNGSEENKEIEEITEVLYGIENSIRRGVQFMQNANERMDLFGDKNGPSIIIEFPNIYKNNYIAAKRRGAKIRFITEITEDNIHYCKELINIVSELRHLDGFIGGIAVTETEYMTTTTLKRKQLLTQVFYSNSLEVVKQGQYIFDTFWNKAILAEQRIKEIEEGVEPVKTVVLENQGDIYNHFVTTIKKSKERFVCSSIGGMRMIYNNFFNLYKDIVEKQKKGGEGNGVKWLTHIDDNKNNIDLVRAFLNAGIQIRHIKNLPSMNFSVDSNRIQATIERMDTGNLMDSLLISNEHVYIQHFMSFFQELWNNYGVDAEERIKDIEEGMEYDSEVIRHSDKSLERYLNVVKSSQSEILFIFPTPKAFIRQLNAIDLAITASKERKTKVRILTPCNEKVKTSIENLLKEEDENKNQENTNHSFVSLSNSDIEVRYIEKMSHTKATILVVDRKESLVMELKDDSKDTFIEAIGFSTYSNSKPAVLSYVAIFENLWKQYELYQEIKDSNESLKMANEKLKVKDKILNEFVHIAAHELRNPIQPILGLSQTAKSLLMQKEKAEINIGKIFNLLDIITRNARKLQQLSDDLLDIAKIETGALYLNKETFDLKELLQILIDDLKNQQQNNLCDIKLHSVIEEQQNVNPFLIEADEARISQVVYNLLINALKFANNDCLIQINMDKKDVGDRKEIIVSIKDTGTGIDPEIYPRLFTKFVSKSDKGIGLGLFICKNIIEAHGGTIWAKNNSDDKGATFAFSLPLEITKDGHT
jgi:two-component system, OmpR family, sensor histidine kinase VicK